MTQDDQTHILAQMQQHIAANMGNRITDALAHGLLSVLTIVTSERVVMPDKVGQPEGETSCKTEMQ